LSLRLRGGANDVTRVHLVWTKRNVRLAREDADEFEVTHAEGARGEFLALPHVFLFVLHDPPYERLVALRCRRFQHLPRHGHVHVFREDLQARASVPHGSRLVLGDEIQVHQDVHHLAVAQHPASRALD